MTFYDYLINNFGILICTFGLVINLLFNRGAAPQMKRMLLVISAIVFLLTIVESGERAATDARLYGSYHIFLSVAGYLLRTIPLCAIAVYFARDRRMRILISIPMAVDFLVCGLAFFTPLVIWFDTDGEFMRGPLGYIPHLIGLFYLVGMIERTVRLFRNRFFQEGIIMLFLALAGVAALFFETFGTGKYLLNMVMAAGFLMYYMFIHVQISARDPLTSLLNRASFYADSERKLLDIKGIISIDMNELKWINDTKGHAAGDAAIVQVADALRSGLGNRFPVYRVGGDEFVAICYCKQRSEAEAAIERARKKLEEAGRSCAFGLSYEDEGKDINIDELLRVADEEMYENKKEMKAKADADGTELHMR